MKHSDYISMMFSRPHLFLTFPLLFSAFLLWGCSNLGGSRGSHELALTEEAFSKIETYYFDEPDYVKLRFGALSGLSKALPSGSFSVVEGPKQTTIVYKSADNVSSEKSFLSISNRNQATRDLLDAYRLARQIAPSIDPRRLEHAMLKTAVLSLNSDCDLLEPDVYNEYVEPAAAAGGIGIEITIQDGRIIVVSPIEESPAQSAGIAPGDRIESVDNISVQGLSLSEVVRMLRGPRGSQVTVRIARDAWPESRTISLQRALVRVQSLKFRFLEGGFAVVSIRAFVSGTARDLDRVLNEMESRRSAGMILDLRQNSGGVLDAAVAVAGRFFDPGIPVASTVSRARSESKRFLTQAGTKISKLPVVIIADKSTSAGAEAVAAKMQESKRALIVGSKTFGHSSVYGILSLSDGSAIKLTIARWITASGRSIEGVGLTPDIQVAGEPVDSLSIGDLERDTYLQRAMQALTAGH
jgi:carboxyl-terminal processing protease